MIGKLVVRVYRAEGLAAADINGKSDPFVKMYLVNQFHRTSTQYKTLNPEWNEMFHFAVNDINNCLDLLVYDEDRHGEDFLGRLVIPLLSVKHKQMVWYQLKDKKLQNAVKGRILLRFDIEWSIVRACIRTFNPIEELDHPPAPVIRKSLMLSNYMRAKTQIMLVVDILKYIKSCFQWEYKSRSLTAFAVFVVVTLYFELWMLPASLLAIFSFNLAVIHSPRLRKLLKLNESKYSTLSDIRHMMVSEESLDDAKLVNSSSKYASSAMMSHLKEMNNNNQYNQPTPQSLLLQHQQQHHQIYNNTDQEEENKSIVERIQAGRDVVILVQDITGNVASYLERVTNTFTFKVPFLSYLMMFCLFVASILLYFVPLRYIILAWGINKFTKKLRNPNFIDNNELVDFLSRVPDNVQCIKAQNIISY